MRTYCEDFWELTYFCWDIFQQQGQMAARGLLGRGEMEQTHALVQTLSQNQDPKFQVWSSGYFHC
jgi:hypothetical protein